MTPIFGPSFIKDCIPPSDPNFGRFVIDKDVIRVSLRDSEGWNNAASSTPTTTLQSSRATDTNAAAADHVAEHATATPKKLRPRKPRALTTAESPFGGSSSEEDYNDNGGKRRRSRRLNRADSPSVSPKTRVLPTARWTSINARDRKEASTTSEDSLGESYGLVFGARAGQGRGGLGEPLMSEQRNPFLPLFPSPSTPAPSAGSVRAAMEMPPPLRPGRAIQYIPAAMASEGQPEGGRKRPAAVDEDGEGDLAGGTKRARANNRSLTSFRSREYNAARTLLLMHADDAKLSRTGAAVPSAVEDLESEGGSG